MATYLLVHGSWHGAWCWERVSPLVQQAGHQVVAPDLPGHGADPTPVTDRPYERYVPCILEILDHQPEPVILVGHSSGGMLISEAARQRPERIAALVYLAAFLLPPDLAPPDVMRDDAETLLPTALVVDHEQGVVTVKPDHARAVFYADCSVEDAAWATARLTPEPIMPLPSPPAPAGGGADAGTGRIPRIYIECLRDRALGPATQRKMYTASPCDTVYSLPTGHSPFLSTPGLLAACLLEIGDTVAPAPTR